MGSNNSWILIVIILLLLISFGFIGFRLLTINGDSKNTNNYQPKNQLAGIGGLFLDFLEPDVKWKIYHTQTSYGEDLQVIVWYPDNIRLRLGKLPLIVYSHGLSACPIAALGLMNELVKKGYVVVAPDHRDPIKACELDSGLGILPINIFDSFKSFGGNPYDQFPDEENPSDAVMAVFGSYERMTQRHADIKAAINKVAQINVSRLGILAAKTDLTKIGLIGESMGGWTVLGVAGADSRAKDSRIKAVFVYEPVTALYANQDFKNIDANTFYMVGDTANLLSSANSDAIFKADITRAYDYQTPSKYFAILKGAEHHTFSPASCAVPVFADSVGCQNYDQKISQINYYVHNLFDGYLKNDSLAKLRTLQYNTVYIDGYKAIAEGQFIGAENCINQIDDDGDGAIDIGDSDCASHQCSVDTVKSWPVSGTGTGAFIDPFDRWVNGPYGSCCGVDQCFGRQVGCVDDGYKLAGSGGVCSYNSQASHYKARWCKEGYHLNIFGVCLK